MKVVQKDGIRSDETLDGDSINRDLETDPISEELDHSRPGEIQDQKIGLRDSLKAIFLWRNYKVYLATAWFVNAIIYLDSFFNLYIWTIVPNLVFVGGISTAASIISTVGRFFGGYIGDRVNRKSLAVASMFILAIYYLMIGIFIDPLFIFVALIINASVEVTKGGSNAYIMDNIPREHSGLALSLFTAGRILSVITLSVFGILYPLMDFAAFRLLSLFGGILLIVSAILRARYLEDSKENKREAGTKLWRVFIEDNKRALKLLVAVVPGMLVVCILDSISDSFFKLGAFIYLYTDLYVSIPSMVIMLIATIVIQVPILLKVGRLTDRKGVKSTALLIYAIMPISAALLILASSFPFWAPQSFSTAADALVPGLGIIFKTSFLAVVLKYVNDTLWGTIVLVLIRKRLPSHDTAKFLSLFWFIVWLTSSFGPLIGGIISESTSILYLFVGVLILNLFILGAIAKYDLATEGTLYEEGVQR